MNLDPNQQQRPARRQRLMQSPKVLAQARAARKREGLIIEGLKPGTLRTFEPKDLTRLLNIDESYQRLRISGHVNDLIHVLTKGGCIPDPITVAKRPDGSLWIVDGQQRYWAHVDTGTALKAIVYDVESVEQEKQMFLALDRHRKVGAGYFVKAWNGECAKLIVNAAGEEDSPFFGRVDLGGNTQRPFAATTMLRGMLAAMNGQVARGQVQAILERSDVSWAQDEGAPQRARRYLELIAAVFVYGTQTPIRLMPIVAIAFGRVAHEYWQGQESYRLPDAKVVMALRKVNWLRLTPTASTEYLILVEQRIRAIWKPE